MIAVRIWEELVTIPTYGIGKPNKNPMFLEKRVYQGSSGVVYPYPVIDRVYDEKADKQYSAIFLENQYLKIMLLPEIGGRVQMALDKTNGYHFVYYNRVIKPALVGLTGPWISGGIEFNWPQHHRPSTFEPVDYSIEMNPDGSGTVWLSEIERMFRMKGMAGFTLYPERAYLEINVQLYNRTSEPQTFLWWANPAVHVNEDYQSVFPPDVHAVMDHGKRDVSTFPIATGTYYKVDYAPGTDISRYRNIPVPTSYMAYHSDFDFLGSYDHGKQAGMMHVAIHHTVPGKKQWTWGNGDFGKAWDRQLTDEDGPYIELMCGAYTDNQPDFSWLMPGEEKRFTQVFMPYKLIGGAKNASKDVVINLEVAEPRAHIGVYVTTPRTVKVELRVRDAVVFHRIVQLSPESAFVHIVDLPPDIRPQEVTLRVLQNEQVLIAFTPLPEAEPAIPNPATAAPLPAEILSNEELFLNGLHLEQYRHATYQPEAYYEEALRRDPLDSRCNNAIGRLLYRRSKFAEAEAYFRKAVQSLTRRNPNPYGGEPYYNLGLALKMQGRYAEAYDAFYKATWNAAWQNPAYFELARLTCRNGEYHEAMELADRALARNHYDHKARHLRIALLRHLGRSDEAADEINMSLKLDCMNTGTLYERWIMSGDDTNLAALLQSNNIRIETALDYVHAGLFPEALDILTKTNDPMAAYFMGWIHTLKGSRNDAKTAFNRAASLAIDYCFPNQLECVPALECAIQYNPNDAHVFYALGNFWYGHRRYDEAVACWERSRAIEPDFPTVHRNLGLAYVNKHHDPERGLSAYQRAFELDPTDARVFFELDQLHKKCGDTPQARLARLENHRHLVDERDDLTIEYVTLLNILERQEDALNILTTRTFHPWEGGEGKVAAQYVIALVELAKRKISANEFDTALDLLLRALIYPHNLGEGKLIGAQDNNIHYYLGCVYEAQGNPAQAHDHFVRASAGSSEPNAPMFYNDQPPEMIFYQGQALIKLGDRTSASSIFRKLIEYGTDHLNDPVSIDYFAVSLPDFLVFDEDLNRRNRIHCLYLRGLGHLGLENYDRATADFDAILSLAPCHVGAVLHRRLIADNI